MAQLPLNTFRTKTTILTSATTYTSYASTGTSTVYTAPIGVTAIVLMAQVSNLTTVTQFVNFIHHRNRPILADAQGNGAQAGNTDSFLVKDFAIPAGDAGTPLAGKMIVESLDSIRAFSSGNTTGTLQLVLSILETANS
jgi:hypothetical protein